MDCWSDNLSSTVTSKKGESPNNRARTSSPGRSRGATKNSVGSKSSTRTSGSSTRASASSTRSRDSNAPDDTSQSQVTQLAQIFESHRRDLWGLGLITSGILFALAIYGQGLGPLGRDVDRAVGVLFGWCRLILPVVCGGSGILMVVERRRREPLRTFIGIGLGAVAICGLADLGGDNPSLSAHSNALISAGGLLGSVTGHFIAAQIGVLGTAVIFIAMLIAAVLVAARITLASLGHYLASIVAALARAASRWWNGRDLQLSTDELDTDDISEELGPRDEVQLLSPDEADAKDSTYGPSTGGEDLEVEMGEMGYLGSQDLSDVSGLAQEDTLQLSGEVNDSELTSQDDDDGSDSESQRSGFEVISEMPVGEWHLPPLSLLRVSEVHHHDLRALDIAGSELVRALSAHGVETSLLGRTVGPTVTRFELELGPGVKVARVTSLSKDIAYAMASPDVRILAPIPGKSAIGVEVPNRQRQLVALGDILGSPEASAATHPLEVALGRDIAGNVVLVNLASMPHVLISGATGAGKSSCINSLITSILMRSTPDQVRLILVDPKRVELGQYNGLPHLLTPVVVDPKKAANALAWAVKEMERRYDLLASWGMRDITSYNEAYDEGRLEEKYQPSISDQIEAIAKKVGAESRQTIEISKDQPCASSDMEIYPDDESNALTDEREPVQDEELSNEDSHFDEITVEDDKQLEHVEHEHALERLPFIVVVVDELNDLMMVAARDVEESVVRIAQMARAVGIHLVLATQRPSVDVITGVIKANIPSRMAFSVSSLADSRVILDQPGAERLIGKGDMLILTASSNITRRVQAPWVSENEVRSVVAHWRRQGRTSETIVSFDGSGTTQRGQGGTDNQDDELLAQAMELVVRSQLGSTSMLQRKLRVGFARAGRLMDLLEERGVVGPSEGSKTRMVLMTQEELDQGRSA